MKFDSIIEEDELITGINVTPLVDITLVLLIIFMVTATLVIAPAMNVDLPRASRGIDTPPSPLNITITEDARLYLNGQLLSEAELKNKIADLVEDNRDVRAVVAADKNAAHGDFIHVVDILQTLGVENFAIQIQEKQDQPG